MRSQPHLRRRSRWIASHQCRRTANCPNSQRVRSPMDAGCHLVSRRFATSIEPMAQAQNRVLPQHTRACIAHYCPDLFPPRALIAMNRAFDTNRFRQPKTAALQPDTRIIQQPLALRTKRQPGCVMVPAITGDHRRDGLPFPGETLGCKVRRGCPGSIRRRPRRSGFDWRHCGHCQFQLSPTGAAHP